MFQVVVTVIIQILAVFTVQNPVIVLVQMQVIVLLLSMRVLSTSQTLMILKMIFQTLKNFNDQAVDIFAANFKKGRYY